MNGNDEATIPPHLFGASYELAPDEFQRFGRRFGVRNVFLVDDAQRCKNSVRLERAVFVNARCTFWANTIGPPIRCESPTEVIVIRYLHEVGHVHLGHHGDAGLRSSSTGLHIDQGTDFWAQAFGGQEGEAWNFAFEIRSASEAEYSILVDAAKVWYDDHEYSLKDWEDDPASQWRRIRGRELSQEEFIDIPEWVRSRFDT